MNYSRTRSRQVFAKSFPEILYDNHNTIQSNMKNEVDMFVKTNFSKSGIIDDVALASYVFGGLPTNLEEPGHQKVLAYLFAKYCDVTNPYVKDFLRQFANNQKLLRTFGVCSFQRGDAIHFRKLTGQAC